ncbi:MAG: hypothetical protein QOF94_746 [Acidobacteriaceae bacterium]|jgi:hypothetical protein
MTEKENTGRRTSLKQLGAALLGLMGWHVARASTPSPEDDVFASLFVQEGTSVQVPMGYYDSKTQRYRDAKTHKPIFTPDDELMAMAAEADQKSAAKTSLTDEQFAEVMSRGRLIDAMALEKLRAFGQWCTLSQLTSYSTTKCCPIVTDSQRDTQCDDTPNPPPKP